MEYISATRACGEQKMTRNQIESSVSRIQAAPLYSQLSSVFRELITQEEWPIGTAIPSEAELARKYGVSVGTTRKALETLEVGGWVTRKQGRGTFVADPSERHFIRFCRIFFKGTHKSVFNDSIATILKCETRLPEKKEAASLQIGADEKVVQVTRRLDVLGAPFMLEKQTIPEDLISEVDKIQNLSTNLYKFLLQNYGIVVDHCAERLAAVPAPAAVSDVLRLPPSSLVLHTEQEVVDIHEKIVAYVERWFEPSGVEYSVVLE